MSDESLIFTGDNMQLFNKYAKRILTARVFIFLLAAIYLSLGIFGFIFEPKDNAIFLLFFFGSISLIYLIMGILSIRRPFVLYIIAASLTFLFLILLVLVGYSILVEYSGVTIGYCFVLLLTLVGAFFIIRGAVFTKMHKRLARA